MSKFELQYFVVQDYSEQELISISSGLEISALSQQ